MTRLRAENYRTGKYWTHGIQLVEGCTEVDATCAHCWSRQMAARLGRQGVVDGQWTTVRANPKALERLQVTGYKRRPRVWSAWNDLLHEALEWKDTFAPLSRMRYLPDDRLIVLTKRAERLRQFVRELTRPLPANVAFGVSFGQRVNMDRWATLASLPGLTRIVSVEPLIEPMDLSAVVSADGPDWVIVGAETGSQRRRCDEEWAKAIVDQCTQAGVPAWVKGLQIAGRVVHDNQDREWPDWAVRQVPEWLEGE